MTTLTQGTTQETSVNATSGQIKQITRVGSDAIEKVLAELNLTKDGAQRVHSHGDEFASGISEAARKLLLDLSVSDKFNDEEVESSYEYPPDYQGPHNIEKQIQAVAGMFNLNPKPALEYIKHLPSLDSFVPAQALPFVSWFAVPWYEAVNPEYTKAVQVTLDKLSSSRRFENYRKGRIVPERLRQLERTIRMMNQIHKHQPGDIIILALQLGRLHRGRSVRRARERFAGNEYGLNSFVGNVIALTHPERFEKNDELDMDLPGDEFDDPGSGDSFGRAPFLDFDDGRLGFGAGFVSRCFDDYGSGSGFLPQPS
ncbi:MAG: hypothetical protein WC435_03870 [Candidatus Paceibacterota bacterium]